MKILYGLTHTLEGVPIVREVRSVKVGIGLPKGRAMHVWIEEDGQWCIQAGERLTKFGSREEAKAFYDGTKASAPERKYPARLAYFTFTNVSADGLFEPDFEAIEHHGPKPREIDIVFLREDPFNASYQMWTAAELKCEGDGRDARRVVTMGTVEPEYREVAAEAMRNGEKYFEIQSGCRLFNCPYAQGDGNKPPLCKPHGRLTFQLVHSPRLGSTAYFDTTGFRSVSQIFSSLQIFLEMSGRGDPEQGHVAGIPFKMVLRPYKVTFNGRPGTQYGVALEFRAKDALAVKGELIGHAEAYQSSGLLPASSSEPVDINALTLDESEDLEPVTPPPQVATAMAAEFYPEREPDEFNSAEEQPGAIRMPQRKRAEAQECSQPTTAEGADRAVWLETLRKQSWKALPGQRAITLRAIEELFAKGGSVEDIRQALVQFDVESPAELEKSQMGPATIAIRRALANVKAQATIRLLPAQEPPLLEGLSAQ